MSFLWLGGGTWTCWIFIGSDQSFLDDEYTISKGRACPKVDSTWGIVGLEANFHLAKDTS